MSYLRLSLLGPLQIAVDDGPPLRFAYEKVRALLVYLAAERQRPHRREALAELLWPNQPPESSRASLRQALTSLRQALPDLGQAPLLLVTRDTIQLNPAGPYELDLAVFAELIAACDAHGHQSPASCERCVERYTAAVALYRGTFADDLVVPGCPELDEWLRERQEQCSQALIRALAPLADHAEAQGDAARALAFTRRLLAVDPWSDAAHLRLMRLLVAQGELARALEHYRRHQGQLQGELGIEPAAELTALYDHLLTVDARPAAPSAGEPAPISYQLPLPSTSFVGRVAELGELVALLHAPACRLLTLLGPGGIGKTRLALRLAETAGAAFRHGVCWVSLAELDTGEQLAYALARALNPAYRDQQEPRRYIRDFLQPRQLLLLLDGFEHVADGAGLLSELLATAPRLRVVVTSRERLRIGWEWLYDLGGLPFPQGPSDDPGGYPAVELLLARVRQNHALPTAADLPAVRRIAQLTEGLPLAIELAAAAVRRHSYADVAASLAHTSDLLRTTLRDVPERHRSMRAALEQSWKLLGAEEQAALARLSVFRESCAPEAALAVAGADEQLLEELADKSLLQRDGGRYLWHELTRQFAHEQLIAQGHEPQAAAAHLACFADLAEAAGPQLTGEHQQRWVQRLEREQANIRAALQWGLAHHAADAARLAGMLWRFWWMRGHVREGRDWLAQALELRGELDAATRAQVLKGAGGLAYVQGDYATARLHQEAALEQERSRGNQRGAANALHNLALTVSAQGDHAAAGPLFEQALAIHQGLGNSTGVALALDGLAEVATDQGDYARAEGYLRESLALHRERGDRHSASVTRLNLAGLSLLRDEPAGLAQEAANLLAEFRAFGNSQGIAVSLHLQGKVALRAGELGQARSYLAEALSCLQGDDLRHDLAACLVTVAMLAGREGDWGRAARLLGAATGLCAAEGGRLMPPESIDYEHTLAEARRALSGSADAAWAAGHELGRTGALSEALGGALDPAAEAAAQPQTTPPHSLAERAQAGCVFGAWVLQRRKALGLSQPELARRVGCSRETIGKIEAQRRRPSAHMAQRLGQCLEIAPADLPAFLRAAQGEDKAEGAWPIAAVRTNEPSPPGPLSLARERGKPRERRG